ncbi:MAG: arsenate reductase ArsC [Emcibacter sp.]|nr:arsenate reductase ArsC [Emcibacter sp.]
MLLEPQHPRAAFTILVLCTGNSARSIMAEALFNDESGSYFKAYSAGSHPTGKVNPFAVEQIGKLESGGEWRSKSWDEFGGSLAPHLDFVITVCGNAAQEICPCFSGSPQHIHWGLPDPAAVTGAEDDIRRAFTDCFAVLQTRIKKLTRQMSREMERAQVVALMQDLALDHSRDHSEHYLEKI